MKNASFYGDLFEELGGSFYNYFGGDNWDELRFGKYTRSWKEALLESINSLLFGRLAFLPKRDNQAKNVGEFIRKFGDGLAQSYDLLGDEYSRSTLIRVLAYRVLGYRKVKLPLNSCDFFHERRQVSALIKSKERLPAKFLGWHLDYFELNEIGYPIKLYFTANGVFTIFKIKHYEYQKGRAVVKAGPGDYVIDGGGCWGDTALYFADQVGESGKVFTFEFGQDNLNILDRNLQLNPDLLTRIQIVKNALWDKSDESLSFVENGPGSVVSRDKTGSEEGIYSLAIDDFVERNRVERVDFIKMDIEGAELPALRGAEETIKRFRPKMAICLYHSIDDFIQIPAYLSSLNLGYRFYLDHFTIHAEETVLFAEPSGRR